ncbi:peptidoglycan DD-metalloendopeptidase family protein [Luteibacter yeojuensis]|uniref:Peptidoglycan DD-metalloendopeptidase family protein n=1 Tax=Luteibacter yeojuensis TaxID=345309 RepID=A0A7X5QTJ7_9GAMM|nr:peptidoglycan DD-metalloendopeptidase family protein [Luteibacter yeojuensis]NID15172.1 peptidoglycan DD-metalloendopeptidase family protein [Luteibacter yeojuensis]
MLVNRPLVVSIVLAASLVLAGCDLTRSSVVVTRSAGSYETARPATPTPPPGGSYRVVKGDTLYSIAFRNKVDFRDLANWNGIASPYTIWPGQDLRLSPPGREVRAGAPVSHPAPAVAAVPHPTPASPASQPGVAPVTGSAAASSVLPAPATTTNTPVVVAGQPAESLVPTPPAPSASTPAPVENPPASTPIVAKGATRSVGGIAWRWPADGVLLKKFSSGDAIPGIEVGGKAGDPVRAAADGVVVYSGNGLVGYGELVIIKHSDSFLSAYGHNRKRLVKEGEKVKAGQSVAEMGSTGATRDELQFQIRRDGNPVDPLQYLPPR